MDPSQYNPSQSDCSSSPEPSTSEDAVPSRGEEEEDYFDDDEPLHGEISNPPSPLGGRMSSAPGRTHHELEVISSSTCVNQGESIDESQDSEDSLLPLEEPLIDSTVDSSGMSRVSAPRQTHIEDEYACQSSSFLPPASTSASIGINDAISTTTSEESAAVGRKRTHPPFSEESNGISSSSSSQEQHPIPSTSSGLTHQEESLHIGQAFSGIPQSFLLMNPPPPPSSQNGNHGPVTSSHSSILESLSGPLSKRLRTLHHLQQRTQDEPSSSPPSSHEEPAQSSSQNVDSSGPSHSSSDDPSSSNNEDEPLPGPSYGTQQTFSVTVEAPYPKASSLSHLTWNQGGLSKARASLPEDLLFLKSEEEGVFAKKEIHAGHRFGPLEGKKIKPCVKESDKILYLIHKDKPEKDDGFAGSRLIDVSNEGQSNWLRFVRQASTFSEQNLSLSQEDEELYFTSTKVISPDEELKVWYSEEYAKMRKLPLLEPSPSPAIVHDLVEPNHEPESGEQEVEEEDREEEGEEEGSWPCFECQVICVSSQTLQSHLNEVHKPKSNLAGSKRSSIRQFKCSSCSRTFQKLYHLRIHLVVFHQRRKKHDNCKACGLKYAHPGISDCSFKRMSKKSKLSKSDNFECSVCGLQFDNGATSDLHSLNHSMSNGKTLDDSKGRMKWKDLHCPECQVEHNSFLELVQHSTSHGFKNKEKEKENIANNIQGPSLQNVENHNENNLRCHLCHKNLLTAERLQRHLIVHKHDESKPFACLECGKRFLTNSALICHSKVHSGGKRSYDCPICGEIFEQVIQLKEHVHIHRIDNQYTCPYCYKVFSEYALIRKHIRAFHSEKKFSCPHCDKSFTGADKLKVHLVKHSDVREFLCNECGKQFKRKDKLKEHAKRMHSPMDELNKPGSDKHIPLKISTVDYRCFIYKCHKCMLGFKRRGMLVNHLANRHPEISLQSVPELNLPILKATRNYYCQYCNKVYKSSTKRKSHILKNHPGLELPVSVRDKAAVRQMSESCGENPTFSAMVGSVTSQPHKCEYCHKQYASKPKLLQHHRKKHSDISPPLSQKNSERKSTSSSSSTSGESSPHDTSSEIVEYRMDPAKVINFKPLEQPETYRLSAAGVAFVPFMPKNESSSNDKNGFVTINASAIKGNHLIVEGPSSLEPSHIEHLINSAQLHVEHSSSSSSWMSST